MTRRSHEPRPASFGRAWPAANLLLVLLTACVSVDEAGVEAFHRGDLAEAMQRFGEAADRRDRNVALYLNDLGTAAMLAGESDEAKNAFLAAGRVMGTFETSRGEEVSAVLLAEGTKTYRGDPYEKAMNSFYGGLLFYRDGEYDTALAGFKAAALADSGTFPEVEGVDDPLAGTRYECDNALVLTMEGRCHRKLGEPQSAGQSIDTAIASLAARGIRNRYLDILRDRDPSATFFVEIGLAPRKVTAGRHGEAVQFVGSEYPERGAEILVDGRTLGRAELIEDLLYQASTQGGREMDAILEGKAIFKDVAVVGGYLAFSQGARHGSQGFAFAGLAAMLAGIFVSAEADVRHWATLPDKVLLLVADVEPGRHDVTVRFRDGGGGLLPGLEQVWNGVEFASDRETLLLYRAGFGPMPVPPSP